MPSGPAFLFDLDGTLVDSVYQHVLAWREALESVGIELSVWRIHRRIGMSGGLFVNALFRETGRELKPEQAAQIRRVHAEAYARQISQVRPLPGARELLAYLTKVGVPWAIGTSGRMESAKPNLDMLAIPAGVPIVTRDQVEHAKPDPDLFLAGAERLGVRGRWGSGSCPAGTEKKSWSGPARIACIRTPPTCSNTSTRWVCAWGARRRSSSREVLVLPQLHHTVPRARLPVVGLVTLAHPGRQRQREVTGEGLDVGLVHAAQLGEPLLEVGPGLERQAAAREAVAQPRQPRRLQSVIGPPRRRAVHLRQIDHRVARHRERQLGLPHAPPLEPHDHERARVQDGREGRHPRLVVVLRPEIAERWIRQMALEHVGGPALPFLEQIGQRRGARIRPVPPQELGRAGR